ncbi:MAG: GNAT family N-acetyltransferase [Phycisphaeraceae bacterium]|nr:GNAT family N-acetyltransferase [Phycisphaeraceae bacterium]
MAIELIAAGAEHSGALARLCHLAFDTLQQRHRVPRDVPDEEVGGLIIGGVLHRPDYAGVVAVDDGRIVGAGFLQDADEVCGIGPIIVDPGAQSRGVGRTIMGWIVEEARRRRGPDCRARLFQEALNTTSLGLYARLGFDWQEAAAMMTPPPAERADPSVRAMEAGDLKDVDRLSAAHGGSSRVNDARQLLRLGLPGFVRERGGRVCAYGFATLFGHSAGESEDDVLDLAAQTARHVPPPMSVIIVPMGQGTLFRGALARGFRIGKVLNWMSIGRHVSPAGPSMPSIQC